MDKEDRVYIFVSIISEITIKTMNLHSTSNKVGLAVSDIKAAKHDADLKQQAERARLVLESEVALPDRVRKMFVRETEVRSKPSAFFKPNSAGGGNNESNDATSSRDLKSAGSEDRRAGASDAEIIEDVR